MSHKSIGVSLDEKIVEKLRKRREEKGIPISFQVSQALKDWDRIETEVK